MRRSLTLQVALACLAATAHGDIHFNPSRGYGWSGEPRESSVITNPDADTLTLSAATGFSGGDFRIALAIEDLHGDGRKYPAGERAGKRLTAVHPGYAVEMTDADGRKLTFSHATSLSGDDEWRKTSRTIAVTAPDGEKSVVKPPKQYKHDKRNLLVVKRENGRITVAAGHDETAGVWSAVSDFTPSRLAIVLPPGGAVDVPLVEAEEYRPDVPSPRSAGEIDDAVTDISDRRAGYWRLTARQLEENTARCGGDYILALVPDAGGAYTLYYIDGAAINPSSWPRGAVKARLIPRINGRYDVAWYDADHRKIEGDVAAIFDGSDLLTVHFPYYDNSTLTFQRLSGYRPAAPTVYDSTDP